jgi:uncharacterized protein
MDWLWHALAISGSMTWEILWALILGFILSAMVQAVVRRETIKRTLGGDSPRSLAAATGFGIASSSCSYASVALARALFRKGAGSCWRCCSGSSCAAGWSPTPWSRRTRAWPGSMEGHAAMDMSVTGSDSFWRRLTSARGLTSLSHVFVMEWAAIWRDIVIGR